MGEMQTMLTVTVKGDFNNRTEKKIEDNKLE